MAIEVQCDACQQRYRLPEKMAGKRVRCRDCGAAIEVPSIAVADEANQELTDLSDFESGMIQSQRDDDDEWSSDANPFDIPASFREVRGRVVPRPITPLKYPLSDMVESLLPWLLVGIFLVPAIWQASANILKMPRPWVGWVELGLVALMYMALAIPLTIRAFRSAARSFKFRLPDSIYWQMFAIFAVPVGLGAFFYAQLEWPGFFFGFGLGIVLSLMLLGIQFSLLPIEVMLSAGFLVSFFVAATVATWYVSTSVQPMGDLMISLASPKKAAEKPAPPKKNQPASPTTQNSKIAALVPAPATLPVVTPAPIAPPSPVSTEVKPQPVQDVVKSDSPAVAEISVLTEPRGFDQSILLPSARNTVGIIRHASSDDQVETWTGDPLQHHGSATFKRTNVNDRCIISPQGDAFVRLTNWPTLSALVWSFDTQKIVRTLELNERSGVPELLAYLNNDQLAIRYDRGGLSMIEIWDLRLQRAVRQIGLPAYLPNALGFSPDGKMMAVAVRSDTNTRDPRDIGPHVQITDLMTARLARKLMITKLDPRRPVTSAAIAFTSDGSRLALLCEYDDNLLIECWQVAAGPTRPVYDHFYPAGTLPLSQLASFPGHAMTWLDKNTLLLYGNVIIDMTTGKQLAALGLPQVRDQQVIDDHDVLIQYQTPQGANALMRVKLNQDALNQARAE